MPRPVTSQPPDSFRQRGRRDWETQDDPRHGITKATVNIPDQVRWIVREDEVEPPLDGEAGQTVLGTDGKAASTSSKGSGTCSLWWTREFKLYYLVYLVGVPLLCWVPIRLSRSECVPGMIDKVPSRRSSDMSAAEPSMMLQRIIQITARIPGVCRLAGYSLDRSFVFLTSFS
jgi:hypothetical protein